MPDPLIDLETPPPPAEGAAPPPPGTLPEDDADLDQHALDVPASALQPKAEKVVPIGAVKQERQARRQLADELKTAKEQLAQLQQFQQQATPILQAIQGRQDIIDMLQGKLPAAQAQAPQEDAEAKQYAEVLGMYDASGNLDTVRARKAMDIAAAIADKKAEARIAPVQQSSMQERAQANYQWALDAKDAQGRPYAKADTVRTVIGALPAQMLADRTIVQQALIYARGLDPVAPARDVPEPLFTEAPGGRMPQATGQITAVERAAMHAIGADEKTWSKLTAQLDSHIGRGTIPLE